MTSQKESQKGCLGHLDELASVPHSPVGNTTVVCGGREAGVAKTRLLTVLVGDHPELAHGGWEKCMALTEGGFPRCLLAMAFVRCCDRRIARTLGKPVARPAHAP